MCVKDMVCAMQTLGSILLCVLRRVLSYSFCFRAVLLHPNKSGGTMVTGRLLLQESH